VDSAESAPAEPADTNRPTLTGSDWQQQLLNLCWVAFSPTNYDPDTGVLPSQTSLREDLRVLRQAGFEGLVTYGANVVPTVFVAEAGFQAMLVGVWDPSNSLELNQAAQASENAVVVGYVVGNEGLGVRYDRQELLAAMDALRKETDRPVATTEELGDYADASLLELGDWVFPNVHPYWHGITDPQRAAEWTAQRFHELEQLTEKPVLFKEVGLPTSGDARVSEDSQASYYAALGDSDIAFVYFEAYDQPWKLWEPVEPHWGLFRADRSPKAVVNGVCGASF
jgi:exo-beta-1,3-glucanase (GH17 family)